MSRKKSSHLAIFFTGWMYFTRVPLPRKLSQRASGSQQTLEQTIRLFPLFGIAIGAIGAAVFLGANQLFDNVGLAILASMLTTILLTGAMHEDGLGDFFDAFGGGWWSKERILEIMKDSRMGTFGVLAIVLALLIKYQSLTALPLELVPATLIAAHAFSRFASGSFFFTSVYVRANDQSYFKPMAKGKMSLGDFCWLSVLGVLPILLLGDWRYFILVPALWVVRSLFGRWFVRKLGGYTGDCLGAIQQVTEISFYLGVIILSGILA